jgi:hypothetical protein
MSKYQKNLKGIFSLSRSSGVSVDVDENFLALSARVVSGCVFAQNQIQKIIYAAFAEEVHRAGHSLKNLSSPKARLEFLENYNSISANPDISLVYIFAKNLFADLYQLRNSLVHDVWQSSCEFPGDLLLSSLDEEARLLFSSEKLSHLEDANAAETFKAIIRFIESVKILSLNDLTRAVKDVNICNLLLMQIGFAMEQTEKAEIDKIVQMFLTFEGVSHIFPEERRLTGKSEWSSKSGRTVNE